MWFSQLSLLLTLLGCTWSAPFKKSNRYEAVMNEDLSLQHLNKYGYNSCAKSSKNFACSVDYRSMLRAYQKQHALRVTGVLDSSTKKEMKRPRCGNTDVRAVRSDDAKWSRSSLTWSLSSYPRQISKERATSIMRDAFNAWLVHIPLKVTEVCATCSADLKIDFGGRGHHCPNGDGFDGPGFHSGSRILSRGWKDSFRYR